MITRKRGRPRLEDVRPEAREIIGKVPDNQAARMLGVTKACIVATRKRLGLTAIEAPSYTENPYLQIRNLEKVVAALLERLNEREVTR